MPAKRYSSSTYASRTNTRSSTSARRSSRSATCPTASTNSTRTAKSSSTARAADAASAPPSSCRRAASKTSSTLPEASPPGQPTSIQSCPNTSREITISRHSDDRREEEPQRYALEGIAEILRYAQNDGIACRFANRKPAGALSSAPFCMRQVLPDLHPGAYTPVVPDGAFLFITNPPSGRSSWIGSHG